MWWSGETVLEIVRHGIIFCTYYGRWWKLDVDSCHIFVAGAPRADMAADTFDMSVLSSLCSPFYSTLTFANSHFLPFSFLIFWLWLFCHFFPLPLSPFPSCCRRYSFSLSLRSRALMSLQWLTAIHCTAHCTAQVCSSQLTPLHCLCTRLLSLSAVDLHSW